jgi:LPXTG-motif cell wall-anchored protein
VTPPPGPATSVESVTKTNPAPPAVLPATVTKPQPLTELPRTGPSDVRFLLLLAGLALVVGGGAVTARR